MALDRDLSYIIHETRKLKKKALIFVNSKARAEKTAEEIAHVLPANSCENLAIEVLKALPQPTKQCKRLAECIKSGVAFHHSGLVSKQRALIEESFRNGELAFISCTPTLALGVDLPAFRTIIRDLKRFSGRTMAWIPVMEYHQIAGRAGRPGKETEGQSIIMLSNQEHEEEIVDKYIHGEPEDVQSKLAVEPVLRTYLLSLISTNFVNSIQGIHEFFSKTFWAYQFEDMQILKEIIGKMLFELDRMGFLTSEGLEVFQATQLGKRVSELYIDPLSAHNLILHLNEAAKRKQRTMEGYLFSICRTNEMRPLSRVKSSEYDTLFIEVNDYLDQFFEDCEQIEETWEILECFKTTLLFQDWCNEKDEDEILQKFDAPPGELHYKLERADWLLYSMNELARILNHHALIKEIAHLRTRMKYGIKEELLQLVQLKGIGRVRARSLHKQGFKDFKTLRNTPFESLAKTLGPALARSIRDQLGLSVPLQDPIDSIETSNPETIESKSEITTQPASAQRTLFDFGK